MKVAARKRRVRKANRPFGLTPIAIARPGETFVSLVVHKGMVFAATQHRIYCLVKQGRKRRLEPIRALIEQAAAHG